MIRHLICIAIHPSALATFFIMGDHNYSVINNGIPKDAKVVQFGQDIKRAEYYIVLEHESFPEVAPHEEVPILSPVFKNLF